MTTTLRLIAFTALTLSALVSSVSAQTVAPITSGDALMNQHLGTRYKGLERSAWVNKLMPAGVGEAPVQMASFDQQVQQMLAGYTREMLDRGGWRNAFVTEDHYAAGEPLLAAAPGEGISTRSNGDTLQARPVLRNIASR